MATAEGRASSSGPPKAWQVASTGRAQGLARPDRIVHDRFGEIGVRELGVQLAPDGLVRPLLRSERESGAAPRRRRSPDGRPGLDPDRQRKGGVGEPFDQDLAVVGARSNASPGTDGDENLPTLPGPEMLDGVRYEGHRPLGSPSPAWLVSPGVQTRTPVTGAGVVLWSHIRALVRPPGRVGKVEPLAPCRRSRRPDEPRRRIAGSGR